MATPTKVISTEDFLGVGSAPAEKTISTDDFLGTPTKPNYGAALFPAIKETAKATYGAIPEFGRGIVNQTSFGTLQKQENPLPGESVFNPPESAGRKAGKVAGGIITLIASEALAGLGMPALVAKYGLSAVQEAVASGALTGAAYEGMKGAVQGKPALDTAGDMAKTGLQFGAMGAATYPLGVFANKIKKDVPEQLAQSYIPAPANLAKDILRDEQPMLGSQYLETAKTQAGANLGKGQRADYFALNDKLDALEANLQGKLDQRVSQATTPNIPQVPTPKSQTIDLAGTQAPPALTYNPGQVQQVAPGAGRTGLGTIQPPTNITESVPSRNIPFNPSEPMERGALGEPVRPLNKETPGLLPQTQLGGFDRTREVGSASGLGVESPQRTNLGGLTRGLGGPPAISYKAGPVVDLQAARDAVEPLAQAQERGGNMAEAKALREWAANFGKDESGQALEYADLRSGNDLRRWLDSERGSRSHLQMTRDMNVMDMGQKLVGDNIRNQIATQAPEVAELLGQQHKFLNYKTALEPAAAGVRESSFAQPASGLIAKSIKFLAPKGSEIGLAKGIEKGLTRSATTKNLSRAGTRLGLLNYTDEE